MLGFIASIFTLLQSFFIAVKNIFDIIPTTISFVVDFSDFVSDQYNIWFAELNSPLVLLAYIFLQLVIVRLIIQII